MKERVVFPKEIYTNAKYFFEQPEAYDPKVAKKKWSKEVVAIFNDYTAEISNISTFTTETAKEILQKILEEKGVGMGKVMQALRLAITGGSGGPDLMPVLEVIGKEEVINRINNASEKLSEFAS